MRPASKRLPGLIFEDEFIISPTPKKALVESGRKTKGMTAYLKILNTAINKPFKDHLRIEVDDFMENIMVRNDRGNLAKPRLQEIET